MKWLDPAWWKGLHRILAIECPEEVEGNYRLLLLEKDQDKIWLLRHWEGCGLESVKAELSRDPKASILLGYWSQYEFEKLLEADQLEDAVSGVLGVGVENRSEFSLTFFEGSAGKKLVGLIRKEKADDILGRFGVEKERIIDFCFSEAVLLHLVPYLTLSSEGTNIELKVNEEKRYLLKDGLVSNAGELVNENYERVDVADVERGLSIPSGYGKLYAATIALWSESEKKEGPLQAKLEDFVRTNRLKHTAVMASILMGVWFAVLFSFRIQGERKKAELEQVYGQNLPVINAIQNLEDRTIARRKLRDQLTTETLKPSKTSFYLDRIASLVPREITLTEVVIGSEPDDFKRAGIQEEQDFEVIIKGVCASSAPVSSFSTQLAQQAWVDHVDAHKSEMNFQSQVYEFVFLLKLKNV